jgi:hypothetical protein
MNINLAERGHERPFQARKSLSRGRTTQGSVGYANSALG